MNGLVLDDIQNNIYMFASLDRINPVNTLQRECLSFISFRKKFINKLSVCFVYDEVDTRKFPFVSSYFIVINYTPTGF